MICVPGRKYSHCLRNNNKNSREIYARMEGFIDKKALRRAMRGRNGALTAEQRRKASEAIFRMVEALPEFAAARCVALYCALPDEPPTDEALRRWSATKRLVVPRVEGDTMRFFAYDPAKLVRGAFGIAEPAADAPVCEPARIDLMVVPGVAFTRDGARLGRGRGYYDKYLSQNGMRAFRVGVCFAHQIVEALPAEPHDVRMDRVCAG